MSNQRILSDYYVLVFKPDKIVSDIDFKVLQDSGVEVIFATDMKNTIDIMRHREAGAVIAFYESQEKNAIDFLRYIMRQHPHTQRIYITDRIEKELVEKVVNKAHVNYLLVSPIAKNNLPDILLKAFKRYQYLTRPARRYNDLKGITANLLVNVTRYKKEATVDPLTKLYNRRSFDKILDEAITVFHEQQLPFSLILIDLDNFKSINDKYGHPGGDEVLKDFGKILNKNMRREDSAFRYGGEEFAIIASDDHADNIKLLVKRIRAEVKNGSVLFEEHYIPYKFSAGIACMQETYTRENIVNAADQALYQAKEQGKDRIIVHSKL